MEKTESLALTQYNFLTTLVINVLKDRLGEALPETDRDTIFKKFVLPGVYWAVEKHKPNLPADKIGDRIKFFVADLRISSEEPEHMEIFLSVVDFVSMFAWMVAKLPSASNYMMIEGLVDVVPTMMEGKRLMPEVKKLIVSNPYGVYVALAGFGRQQDVRNYELLLKHYEETRGDWDWEFFNEHNLMLPVLECLEKFREKNAAIARQKQMKETKDRLYRENKPTNAIDKFVWKIKTAKYNTAKTFKESEVISGVKRKIKKAFGGN